MGVFQHELEARYAGEVCADASRLIAAKHVPDALSKLGLIRSEDRLVVFADDFQDAFTERFPRESLFFVLEPTVEAFAGASRAAMGEGKTFWFVNAVGGCGLRVPDLRALAAAAHAADALLVVDNTVPSLFGCRPLSLGADLCFEALDRVAAGELRCKTVAVAWGRRVSTTNLVENPLVGRIDSTDLVAIEHGLDSLPSRMQRHFDCARAIAEYLSCCDAIPSVAYPGLAPHPDHATAANTLVHGYGPAIDFELSEHAAAGAFIERCRLNGRNQPAGGPYTRMAARDGDDARFIRLFAGTDDPLAIADDLDQALRLFCNPPEP